MTLKQEEGRSGRKLHRKPRRGFKNRRPRGRGGYR